MEYKFTSSLLWSGLILLGLCRWSAAQEVQIDKSDLTFLATFDSSPKADFGLGSLEETIAEDVSRKKFLGRTGIDGVGPYVHGKYGAAINFAKKTRKIFCYKAEKNFPYSQNEFDVTISFWMKCDLGKLPDGFIDPLQITDKKWNDASIFVDFNDQRPADFRLGVFSDSDHWNPQKKDFQKMDASERPMVDAGKFPFAKDRWTHVGIVLKGVNAKKSKTSSQLYLDGKLIGDLKRNQRFSWDPKQAYIMLGIYFVGQIDDFAIFKTALSAKQIQSIVKSDKSLKSLLTK